MNFYKKNILLLLSLAATATLSAQTTLKGTITESETGEAIAYAVIKNSDASVGSRANIDGFYLIPDIPGDSITLRISAIGYVDLDTTLALTGGMQLLNLELGRFYNKTVEVDVSADRTEKTKEVNIGVTKITPTDINALPSVGGEADLAQYLQLTPGIVNSGDQGGQLFIRGGSPVQNKILLDGMTIYNPFHSIGLYSVFETELIRTSDVITGAFDATYGNRTSAIVDVKTKDGNKKKFSGQLSASPIMGRVVLEGPLQRVPEGENANTTFVFSGKYSYLDQTSKSLYGNLDGIDPEVGLPYTFSDLFGKVTFGSNTGTKFSAFGFNFNDKNSFPNIPSYNWNSYGAGANFIITPARSSMLTSGSVSYSNYAIRSDEGATYDRQSSIGGFEAALNFTYFLKNFSEFIYGFEFQGFNTVYNYETVYGTQIDETQYTTQAGGYLFYRKNFDDKFILEPSVRTMYYASLNEVTLEPRLGLKYNINEHIRLKAGGGFYSQNLISTKSDQDIVNYFTGFISGPENTLIGFDGQESKSNLQKSSQILAGVEFDYNGFEFTVEPWLKNFDPLININRVRLDLYDPEYMIEKGKSSGIDFGLKYIKKRIRIQGVFSLMQLSRSFVQADGTVQEYAPPFDRRQNVNVLAVYKLGKNQSWRLSTRYSYGSALPFTQTQAFYQQYDVADGGAATDFTTNNGNMGVVFSDQINNGRLSDYARLDFNVEKIITLKKDKSIKLDFSITNVLNRRNVFYIDRVTYNTVYQLPFLPSISTAFRF